MPVPVAQLLHESTDRDHIDEIADDWMVESPTGYGTDDLACDANNAGDADDMGEAYDAIDSSDLPEGTAAAKVAALASAQLEPASKRAVISLDSPATDAEQQFRMAIVTLDGIPGNQVEGISPLYHVSQLDGLPDKMAAVIQISTRMGAHDLIEALSNVEASVGEDFDLDLIDMEGVTCDEPDCKVPWPTARNHAAVLAPWLDMDPDARLGKDPVSFLLAMAPDTAQVGTADRQLDHRRYAMKARRTPWWCYVLAAALGLLGRYGIGEIWRDFRFAIGRRSMDRARGVGDSGIRRAVYGIADPQIHHHGSRKTRAAETFGPAEGVRHTGVMQSVGRGRSGVGRLVWWTAHHEPAAW